MKKLVFGCGYLGLRVARLWRSAGNEVVAVTRSAERAARLAAEGLQPVVADLTDAQRVQLPADIGTVLFAVGFDRAAGRSIHEVYVEGLRRALGWLPPSVERFLYVSTTGVYGQVTGEWVDENSPCQPTREGGKASLAAEQLLAEHPLGERTIVLRLAGIYGPGRIPRSRELQAGQPIDAPAEGMLNLIHVDDAARIVLLAEERAQPPRTYVISDGHPVVRADYYRELARLLGAPPPNFVAPDPSSPAAQRAASDKRIDNRRCLEELQPQLIYPSYRDGLAAIVGERGE
jgi:nucleoside-diphosphate-sugar epimerase